MPSTPTATTWTCATCGAVTTDRGRELLGSRCWMCGGRLILSAWAESFAEWAEVQEAIGRDRALNTARHAAHNGEGDRR